jgi:hypothetical protein
MFELKGRLCLYYQAFFGFLVTRNQHTLACRRWNPHSSAGRFSRFSRNQMGPHPLPASNPSVCAGKKPWLLHWIIVASLVGAVHADAAAAQAAERHATGGATWRDWLMAWWSIIVYTSLYKCWDCPYKGYWSTNSSLVIWRLAMEHGAVIGCPHSIAIFEIPAAT